MGAAQAPDNYAARSELPAAKVEREKEHDMPGASLKTVRRAFLRPVNVRREGE